MSRVGAAAMGGTGFVLGGILGGAIAGQLASDHRVGPASKREIERMALGAGIGAFLGSVSLAAASYPASDEPQLQVRFP